MALQFGTAGGGGRPTRRVTPMSPWGDAYSEIGRWTPQQWQTPADLWATVPALSESQLRMLPGRGLWPEEEAQYTPPTGPPPLGPPVTINIGPPAAETEMLRRIGMSKEMPMPAPAAPAWQPTGGGGGGGWGGGGGGGGEQPPAQPAAPIAPTPWQQYLTPFYGGGGAPANWLRLMTQDWWAIPQEVRAELERWLRQSGWRPGAGGWGRYGALGWQQAAGAQPWAQPGGYLGEQAFAGVSERMKPWLYWFSQMKGWSPGREEAVRPPTTGWTW